MSTRVLTGTSAEEVASAYMSERYPELEVTGTGSLELEPGWLVEVLVRRAGTDSPPARSLLMVNRFGWVEELGAAASQRRKAKGLLDELRKVNEVIDLRSAPYPGGGRAAPPARAALPERADVDAWLR